MYKNDAIMFLQDAFLEENFCNNSGICSSNVQENLFSSLRSTKLISAMLPFANMLTKFWKGLPVDAVENFSLNDYISTERQNPLMASVPTLFTKASSLVCFSFLCHCGNKEENRVCSLTLEHEIKTWLKLVEKLWKFDKLKKSETLDDFK